VLFELARLLRFNADELSRLESIDTGKPLSQSATDVEVAAQYFEFYGVLAVIKAADEAHAIEIADGTDFGLVSSVWTRDVNTAMRVAQEIDQGQVYINSYGAAGGVPLPFGGYKKSGFGREKGVEGVFAYTQTKTVVLNVPAE
jgi:aldehyde dehydrogenase (NAD+)/betaine-aldehyde dehydrogenase